MTHSRFGLTSRSLRQAVAHEIASPYGYEADDLLDDEAVKQGLQISISSRGWRVWAHGRTSSVSIAQDDPASVTNRRELVDQVADAGFHDFREAIGEAMRSRALRAAGMTEWDAAPEWSVLVSPLLRAIAVATGVPERRLCLLATDGSRMPVFADLKEDETLEPTGSYRRKEGARRDRLRGGDPHLWWKLEHRMEIVDDERFPIRSVSVGAVETTVELRHGLALTQRLGIVGSPTGAFIGLDGAQVGTPGGDTPIRRVEHDDVWNRTSFVTDSVFVPAAAPPGGVDARWADMFATRMRRRPVR